VSKPLTPEKISDWAADHREREEHLAWSRLLRAAKKVRGLLERIEELERAVDKAELARDVALCRLNNPNAIFATRVD